MIRLRLLGTGSPDSLPERQGAAVLLSRGGEHLLFDAGRGVVTQLARAGIAPQDLGAVFLTHHHYDHIASLGDLLISCWHGGIAHLPVVGPSGTAEIVEALFDRVYHREIAFSLKLAEAAGARKPDIRDVVAVNVITEGPAYGHGAWRVMAGAVDHGRRLGLTPAEWPCYGYRVEVDGKSVVVSGDTVACDSLIALAHGADVLVQCCYLADADLTTPARRLLSDAVIATSGQAGKIAARAGVKTLVLTHFGTMAPEMLARIEADVRRDFGGLLYMGRDLLAIDV